MNEPIHSDSSILPSWILIADVISLWSLHWLLFPSTTTEVKSAFCPKNNWLLIPLLINLTDIRTPFLPPLRSSNISRLGRNESKQVRWASLKSLRRGVVSTTWLFFKIEISLPLFEWGVTSMQKRWSKNINYMYFESKKYLWIFFKVYLAIWVLLPW